MGKRGLPFPILKNHAGGRKKKKKSTNENIQRTKNRRKIRFHWNEDTSVTLNHSGEEGLAKVGKVKQKWEVSRDPQWPTPTMKPLSASHSSSGAGTFLLLESATRGALEEEQKEERVRPGLGFIPVVAVGSTKSWFQSPDFSAFLEHHLIPS